jgi:hypothetical protein
MQYKYIGDGAGIAGLPHVVTDEEAAAAGVTGILTAALKNGSYVSVETDDLTPGPFPEGKGEKTRKSR